MSCCYKCFNFGFKTSICQLDEERAKVQLFCADESSLTTSDSFAEEGVVGVRSLAMTWLHPCQ